MGTQRKGGVGAVDYLTRNIMATSNDWETTFNSLETAAKDLRQAMTDALTDKAEKTDEPEKSALQQKMDALDETISTLKAAFPPEDEEKSKEKKADEAAKAKSGYGSEDEEKEDKKKADEADEAAKAKGKQAPPFGKPEEEEMADGKSKTKKSDDSPLPWPRDLASKHFREGVAKSVDTARDWGRDPE